MLGAFYFIYTFSRFMRRSFNRLLPPFVLCSLRRGEVQRWYLVSIDTVSYDNGNTNVNNGQDLQVYENAIASVNLCGVQ